MLDSGGREEVASNEHELEEDLLQLLGVGVDDLVFLESFKGTKGASGGVASTVVTGILDDVFVFVWVSSGLPFDEVDSVGVDDAVVAATDSEVVGDEDDRPFGWGCHPGLSWASEWRSSTTFVSATTTTVVVLVSALIVSVVSGLHSNLQRNIRSNKGLTTTYLVNSDL